MVISNISDGQLSFNQTRFVTEEYYNSLAEVRVPQCGDILLTVTGSYGIAVQIQENKKFCFQRHIALLKTILTNNKLLEQWLSSGFSKKQFDNSVTGTAQQTLGLNALRSTLLPLPPLAEQQRIVEQIETLLGYVDIIDTDAETLEKSITLAKQKILDLAIRGKLVPQDPTDEPASKLLKKIKAEKEALIKAGKLKKDKHESFIYKGDDNCYYWQLSNEKKIIDDIPFEIPDTWEWCCIDQIMYPVKTKDKQIKSGEILLKGSFPVVSQGQENIDGFCDDESKTISDLPVVLFGDHTKKVKYIDFTFVVGADGTKIFKPLCCARWLFYWTSYTATAIGDRGYGRHWNLLCSRIIPLPPLSEQEKIVSHITQYETILKSIQE